MVTPVLPVRLMVNNTPPSPSKTLGFTKKDVASVFPKPSGIRLRNLFTALLFSLTAINAHSERNTANSSSEAVHSKKNSSAATSCSLNESVFKPLELANRSISLKNGGQISLETTAAFGEYFSSAGYLLLKHPIAIAAKRQVSRNDHFLFIWLVRGA